MNMKICRAFLATTLLCSTSAIAQSSAAKEGSEADAVSPKPATSLSGFVDLSLKNDYVTPRGLVVHSRGETVQIADGLNVTIPSGITFTAGTWIDLNPGYQAPNTNSINEFDVFVGASGTVANRVKLGVQYVEFISGQHAYPDAKNIEFTVGYIDGAKAARFTVNPYAKLFWNVAGGSTVAIGKVGNTFDVEIGAVPTLAIGKGVTLFVPTWFTVAPKSFFGPIDDGNIGVISSGLKVAKALDMGHAGKWSVYAFGQYYRLSNDNLVLAKSVLNQGDHSPNHFQFGIGVAVGL
jgi:hypothetical protein